MPKFASKSRSSQRTISSYFTGANQRPGAKQKVSASTDDGNLGAPAKRARLQQEEPEGPRNQEASVSLSRGPAGISSTTLEKLRGFTCLSEPSINPSYSEREQETHECSGENIIQLKSQVPRPANATQCQPEQENQDEEDDDVEQEEDGSRQASSNKVAKSRGEGRRKGGGAKPKETKPGSDPRRVKSVYTPLEQQIIQLKQQHKDALLAVECGYKYRFFGEDAEIAAKELNIFCHPDHNFMTCSIPTHRLFVHVRRLVSHGHKVAVVKQTETSAIKASGTNRNALFTRQLSALYTKSTLVGEDVNPVCRLGDVDQGSSADVQSEPPESFLLCISENCDKVKKQLTVGLVAVQPSTGDVFLDCFPDGPSRSELESRVLRINPVEILVPSDLSDETHRLLKSISNASAQADDRARLEMRDSADFDFASAMNTVTEFYCGSQEAGSRMLSSVASLEAPLICCLGPLIHYLQEFNLERVLRSQSPFQRLSCASEGLNLGAATLRNLEILNNQTDGGARGSLLWVLDHTSTHFGRRLMRNWVSQPLTNVQCILDRQTAVQEILESNSHTLTSVQSLLTHLPDLDRGICSIYHKRSSTQEFYLISSSLSRLALELEALLPAIQSQVSSPLLRDLLLDTPNLLAPAHSFLKVLSEKAAKSGNKTELFSDLSDFPALRERKEQIQEVTDDIYEHRKEIRLKLKAPTLEYTAVSGQEFLIEVKNSLSSTVPLDWLKISSTKAVSRYHSPFLVERYKKLLQLREQLLLDCQREWIHFLDRFGQHYHTMKRAISHLATLDCLLSLAQVAKQGHYCRPEVCESRRQIVIRDGRHPAIDLLMGEQSQYVPNDTDLQGDGKRTMVITGPNMGGKSSYIRQVALICVMAQMGSYVPASAASVGILDGIYTRMGASDNIYKGRSTFMEELTEASEIISKASERSLVILDELGRGTSTHDGIAIAYATLQYFVRDVKALTLFVTHYPPLCELERLYPRHVSNHHMAFLLNEPDADADVDGEEIQPEFITFLYQLTEGAAGRSYGLNVARLADIPDSILHTAARKSRELERTVDARRANKRRLADLWRLSERSALLEWLQADC